MTVQEALDRLYEDAKSLGVLDSLESIGDAEDITVMAINFFAATFLDHCRTDKSV